LPIKVIGLPDAAQYRDGSMTPAAMRANDRRQCGLLRIFDSRPQEPTIRE
jgi:hypothetical protein